MRYEVPEDRGFSVDWIATDTMITDALVRRPSEFRIFGWLVGLVEGECSAVRFGVQMSHQSRQEFELSPGNLPFGMPDIQP